VEIELPRVAFFNFLYKAKRMEKLPQADGKLAEWGEDYLLPHFAAMDGWKAFADVYMGWGETWFAFAFRIKGRKDKAGEGRINIFIDTRAIVEAHKASRFCHGFVLKYGGEERIYLERMRIQGAREEATPDMSKIDVGAKWADDAYCVEVLFGYGGLYGYDPVDCPRVSFAYSIRDSEKGRQFWVWDDEKFPVANDPSLWTLVELSQ